MPVRPVIHFENCYHSSAFQDAEEQDIKKTVILPAVL
jgi:hypothetical protein